MAAKSDLKVKAAQIREEMAQTGKLVLRAPALVRAAEYLIRFTLGAVLAGAEIFGGYAPFGLSMVGCSGSGLDGFSALLGACFGYLSFRGLTDGLRYVAAAILIFSVAFAFFDIRLYKRTWFMPVVSALLSGATGFVYLGEEGWEVSTVIFFLTELLLTGAGVYFYRLAFSPWTSRREDGALTPRQLTSLLILGGTVLISLAQLTVLGDTISAGRVLAALAVMVCASQGGLGMGAAVGVAAGLCMDLAQGGPGYFFTVAYGCAGLVTGVLQGQSKTVCAVAYDLTNAVVVLWAWEGGVELPLLYEVFSASVLYLLLPDRFLRKVRSRLIREKGTDTADRAAAYVRERLNETASAFRELYDTMKGAFRRPAPNDADLTTIFDRAADRVCRRCALRDACWQRGYNDTFNALNDALPAMAQRGRGEASDFPQHFTSRCLHFPQFLAASNEALTAVLCRRQYKSRLQENRAAVCRQYGELSALLGAAAAELSAELTPDPVREKRLRQHLTALALEGDAWVYYDEHGHLRCEVEGPDLAPLQEEQERASLSALLGMELREPEEGAASGENGGPERLVFTQAEPLRAVMGAAARQKDGETVSGDAGALFRSASGKVYVLLCDGMGSGPEASRESRLAVRLLEKFLRAGVEAETALKTLNSALALRNEESGGFTTVDLLEVDLFTGEAALYKLGAAPTYVRRGSSVSRITGSALPAGLAAGDRVAPDISRLRLEAGDLVVLVSDGVTTGREDQWLRSALAAFHEGSPKDLARTLVSPEEGEKAADDRTALVVRIDARNP
ncbi:SpoIIE family protein phosphatase [uncultured Intestinimonas sp.]|uniref:SpoIIE family protein phosphatase n=1 Tax=uncultured Intestinimonas sp. TaxID=1689265 RepID=UPI0025CECB56|nr:SpoIIE family protein phosphatase [uncultured Intestinimonas sp.]